MIMNKRTEALCKISSSLKMKIFSAQDIQQAETEMNLWLSVNHVLIQQICQSQCERNGKLLLVISVFYSPIND